ncbi:MAG TPA: DUF3617 family protein [Candidatus Acidoferrales bacterium]|nr:DUF3617 family protein [Candidatus Acidoferrales bacterium]
MNTNLPVKAVAAVAMACWFATAAFAAKVDLRPGRYAFTVTYEVQGERQNESRTAMRCLRQGDLGDPENIFTDRIAGPAKQEETCSVHALKSADGKISYDADCSNRTVHVEGNLNDVGFMVVRTVTPKANARVSLKFTVRGKWLGNCRAAETD